MLLPDAVVVLLWMRIPCSYVVLLLSDGLTLFHCRAWRWLWSQAWKVGTFRLMSQLILSYPSMSGNNAHESLAAYMIWARPSSAQHHNVQGWAEAHLESLNSPWLQATLAGILMESMDELEFVTLNPKP